MRRGPLLVALFLAALTLRPQLVGVGPLLPAIQDDLGVSHAVAGLLGTIPVLCMGVFAPPAPYLVARAGSRVAVAPPCSRVGTFGVVRARRARRGRRRPADHPRRDRMGLAGAMLPVAVKERFADRPGFATGVYTAGMTVGSAVAAAFAVPLAQLGNGWRTPLLVFAAVSVGLGVLWLVLTRASRRMSGSTCDRFDCRSATRSRGGSWLPSSSCRRCSTGSTRGCPTRTSSAAGATAPRARCSRS